MRPWPPSPESALQWANTIVAVSGVPSGIYYDVDAIDYLAVAWTQTQAYAGVTIDAELAGLGTGSAFLMTAIGPNTTAASQIAETSITYPGSTIDEPLFSGLFLGPGTYYLLLSGDTSSQTSGWSIPNLAAYTADAGVTRTVGYYFTDAPRVAYPPAGNFTYYPFDNGPDPIFSVSGALVTPEPSTGGALGMSLLLVLYRRFKPSRRSRLALKTE